MSTSVTSVVSHFPSAQNGFTTTLASTISSGTATVPLNSVAGYTNGQIAVFIVDPADATKKQAFTGVVDTAGVQLTSVVWTAGTNQSHSGGATVVDYATATHISMMTKGLLVQHKQTGAHSAVTADSIVTTGNVTVGGNIAVTGTLSGITPAKFQDPYKSSVYLSGNTSNASGLTKIALNAKLFDTSTNFDATTNFRFTAPIAGFYHFDGNVNFSGNSGNVFQAYLYKNGSSVKQGQALVTSNAFQQAVYVAGIIQLAATDYVELWFNNGAGVSETIIGTAATTYLDVFLVSAT